MTAGKNVKVNAGDDMDHSAGKNISQTAGNDLNQTAAGDISESTNNKTEVIEQKYIRSSLESTQHADKITVFSS